MVDIFVPIIVVRYYCLVVPKCLTQVYEVKKTYWSDTLPTIGIKCLLYRLEGPN